MRSALNMGARHRQPEPSRSSAAIRNLSVSTTRTSGCKLHLGNGTKCVAQVLNKAVFSPR